jgi:hypothetical protein
MSTTCHEGALGDTVAVADVEITTEAVPLTNPRALLGLVANLLVAAVNFGADTGARRAVDVLARVDGRVVGRIRAWTPQSIESAVTAMKEDVDRLPLDEFQRRYSDAGGAR